MNGTQRAPFSRRKLEPVIVLLLWLLRLYVVITVPLVVYAFIKALH